MVTPEQDAQTLHQAMKGLGTDEDTIIKIIANRTNEHRLKIRESFKKQFNKEIIDSFKSELSGNLEDTVVALFQSPIEYDVAQLKKSMKGAGTDEDSLIEIVCTRPQSVLKEIKVKYKETYGKELEEDVKDDTSGDLLRLLLTIIKCERSENANPKHLESEAEAKELIAEGEANWFKEGSKFEKLVLKDSAEEIVLVARHYYKLKNKTILDVIKENCKSDKDVSNLYQSVIYAVTSPSEYFAMKVYKSIKGWGTNDNMLIRVLITRDEKDMPQIKKFYKKLYKKDMLDDIKGDCSGDYQKLLIELAGH